MFDLVRLYQSSICLYPSCSPSQSINFFLCVSCRQYPNGTWSNFHTSQSCCGYTDCNKLDIVLYFASRSAPPFSMTMFLVTLYHSSSDWIPSFLLSLSKNAF